ncbi:MAG TPA: molybdopterin-synthase adenylyltransferase MoeB [Desulfosporosinus sp.]|nr:molybdopterin-synthase adenylyltransferase MoeB [Desulfosporosinus sp.]
MKDNQISRYSKQIILKEIGIKGQQKLLNSKVLVVGAGGLGSPALYYLASAGVGTIGIADFDTVGLSNLQRQILHFTEDIGRKKVDSAEEKLNRLNPDVKIIKYPFRLNDLNIEDVIREYDVVIDCADNFQARYLVSDCCYFLKKPVVEGAVVRFVGKLMTIIPDISPCYRCLNPIPPKDGIMPSCADEGILGAVAGIIGTMQALEAIKILIDFGETLSGRFLLLDGISMKMNEVAIHRSDTCPICGKHPTIKELVSYDVKCKNKAYL